MFFGNHFEQFIKPKKTLLQNLNKITGSTNIFIQIRNLFANPRMNAKSRKSKNVILVLAGSKRFRFPKLRRNARKEYHFRVKIFFFGFQK